MHFTTRATSIDDNDGKSHKITLKSSRNNLTNQIMQVIITPPVIHGLGGGGLKYTNT